MVIDVRQDPSNVQNGDHSSPNTIVNSVSHHNSYPVSYTEQSLNTYPQAHSNRVGNINTIESPYENIGRPPPQTNSYRTNSSKGLTIKMPMISTHNEKTSDHCFHDNKDSSISHSHMHYASNNEQSISSGGQVDHSKLEIVDHSSNDSGILNMKVGNTIPKADAVIVLNLIHEKNANTNDDVGTYPITTSLRLLLCT